MERDGRVEQSLTRIGSVEGEPKDGRWRGVAREGGGKSGGGLAGGLTRRTPWEGTMNDGRPTQGQRRWSLRFGNLPTEGERRNRNNEL